MSFKFNFPIDPSAVDSEGTACKGSEGTMTSEGTVSADDAVGECSGSGVVEVALESPHTRSPHPPHTTWHPVAGIHYITPDPDTITLPADNTDLIPSVYEGGYKVWECTHDLLTYLVDTGTRFEWASRGVLDVGCGAGLLGVYARSRAGAPRVHYQDYNADVLRTVTTQNILCNTRGEGVTGEARLFAGDWNDISRVLRDQHLLYDCMLTSETIYSPHSYCKLHRLFDTLLTTSGQIYVASKAHYFGVGGGTEQFIDYIHAQHRFNCDIVWSTDDAALRRDIIKITRRVE